MCFFVICEKTFRFLIRVKKQKNMAKNLQY